MVHYYFKREVIEGLSNEQRSLICAHILLNIPFFISIPDDSDYKVFGMNFSNQFIEHNGTEKMIHITPMLESGAITANLSLLSNYYNGNNITNDTTF